MRKDRGKGFQQTFVVKDKWGDKRTGSLSIRVEMGHV